MFIKSNAKITPVCSYKFIIEKQRFCDVKKWIMQVKIVWQYIQQRQFGCIFTARRL